MNRKRIIITLLSALLLALVACGSSTSATTSPTTTTAVSGDSAVQPVAVSAGDSSALAATAPVSAAAAMAESSAAVAVPAVETAAGATIALNGDTIAVSGDGVVASGSIATITSAGTYTVSGSLADGQIVVDTGDETAVQIILNGAAIHSSTSAPLYIANAEAVVVVLADGTSNSLTDGTSYAYPTPDEDEPNATLFSNADLTVTGGGALTISGNYNDAIASDDGLAIEGGTIAVTAADDGLRGKDYLVVRGGAITVNAGGDGLKADNEDDATLGTIAIEGGTITVTAGGDAIAAETDVLITGGEFALTAGGGSGSQIAADASAKGIKGSVDVLIDGGTFTIDAADDAIHANGAIAINGGTYTLATGDDGIHADATVTINDGDVQIVDSYEGIESAVITFNGGDIRVTASDDGINVAGGVDGSGMMAGPGRRGPGGPGAPGADASTYTGSTFLYINGGTVVVDAAGDGIDVNGAIVMTDGLVLVNGPTEQMNGALDYDGGFSISGGLLVAAGSAGMAQAPDSSSTQNSVLINLSSAQPAGTLINIRNRAGESVLSFAPSKAYASVAFSSTALVEGETYTVSLGGSDSGAAADGLYRGGGYTPGAEYSDFTVSGAVTMLGNGGGFR